MGSSSFSDTGWAGYFTITSDNTVVDEAIGSVLYRLDNAPASFWSEVKSDGGDIRVTDADGTTAYSLEVGGDFDTTAEVGTIYFDSTRLQTGSDVAWRVYAGNGTAAQPAATATLGRNNVWQDGEQYVAHLEESPTGTIVDSAGNYDGTSAGSMTSGDVVSAPIGNGLDFDGSNDYFHIGNNLDVDPSSESMTMSCWFASTQNSGPTFAHLCGKRPGHNTSHTGYNLVLTTSSGGCRFEVTDGGNLAGEGASGANANDGTAHFIMGVVDHSGATIYLYIDGVDEGSDSLAGVGDTDTTHAFTVGALAGGSDNFDGVIDEVRVYSAALSFNAHKTIYENQKPTSNTFWTTGTWTSIAGETEACSGTSAWTSDSTAVLSCAVPVAATSAWSSDTTATLSCSVPLSATSAWTFDSTAIHTAGVPCSATSAWTSDSTANLSCSVPLSGTSSWTSEATGDCAAVVPLSATCSATSGTSSALSKFIRLDSTSSWTLATSGTLSVAFTLSGTCSGSLDSTAVLSCAVPLASTSAWACSNSATLLLQSPSIAGDGLAAYLDRRDVAAMLAERPAAIEIDARQIAAKVAERSIAAKLDRREIAGRLTT